MKTAIRPAALVAVAALLTACGGGGSDNSPAVPAAVSLQGAFKGTTQNPANGSTQDLDLLVLDTGQYWVPYGTRDASGTLLVTGFLQGTGSTSGTTFTSGDLRDFGSSPATAGTVSATVGTDTVSGTVSGPTQVNFSASRVPTATFDYNAPAAVAQVAGTWSGVSLAGSATQFTVGADGAVTGNSSGCTFAGSLAPHAQVNVFDVSLTFGGAPCALPGQTVTGVALHSTLTTGQQQFVVALVNADRTRGAAVIARR